MARILICHVPKDGSPARDLGSALMGRGHFVSFDGEPDAPRPDRSSRLRQFEAVAVLWTETSSQSAGLAEIARETMPLNLLIPVRAEELDVARLPLMFRKLNMLAPRDIDAIARVVARLATAAMSLREMAERDQQRRSDAAAPDTKRAPVRAAASPPPDPRPDRPVVEARSAVRVRPLANLPEVEAPPSATKAAGLEKALAAARDTRPEAVPPAEEAAQTSTVLSADQLALAIDAGLLVRHIPSSMEFGSPTTVELVLDREMLARIVGARSIETLALSLYSAGDAFEIERQSERTQFITARAGDAARDLATVGRWAWLVTPRAVGEHDLIVRVSALLRDRNGVPGPVAVPDRSFTVSVAAPSGQTLISALAGWRQR